MRLFGFKRGSEPPLPNCYWVIPGRLLAGEHPGAPQPNATRTRVQSLLAAGINCFVDLTMHDELEPYDNMLPPGVEYLRKPIDDHCVPTKHDDMAEILDCVRRALEAGKRVYVHCRAGIGRTGTVIGCLLVESGLAGDEALEELNRLWRTCGRAQAWPTIPETDEQVDYIRQWRRPPPPSVTPGPSIAHTPRSPMESVAPRGTPQPAARTVRERYLGALVGLAVGDALAAATQQLQPGTFTPITDLVGGGPFDVPRGAWTDDTAMALCLAESLLECRGFDARDQVERYTRWQQEGYLSATGECIGITPNTARALAMARWRRLLFAGSHDPTHVEPNALSRVAPAVMFFLPFREQALEFATDAARTTNQAPLVLQVCRVFAAMLHAALQGQPKAQVLAPPWDFATNQVKPEVRSLLEGHYRARDPAALRTGENIAQTLEVALFAFDRTNNFADGALLAVNAGECSDVAGAVYGQLAGAHYGIDAIPQGWRQALAKRDLIETLALRLLAQTKVDSV